MKAPSEESASSNDDRIARGNGFYQRQLAECLQQTLGTHAAIRACQALGWDGVIQYVIYNEANSAR